MRILNENVVARGALACVAIMILAACGQKEAVTNAPAATEQTSAMASTVPYTTASEEARTLFNEGLALLDDLHFTDAHTKFLAAVQADPDFAMGHVLAANTSQSAEEFFAHVGHAKATAAGASKGEQLYVQALVAASENDQAAQGAALKQVVSAYPKDPRTHMALGNFLNGQQDFAGAVEHFRHATQVDPDFAPAFNSLGYGYRALDDLDKAQAAFEKYVALLPNESNPHDSYAELLMEMGNYDESIKQYQMAIDLDPHFLSAYAGISRNYSMMGEPENALEAADKMLGAARNFAERQNAMFQSVMSYVFAGNREAAMEVSNKMLMEAEEERDRAAAGGIYNYMGDISLNVDDTEMAEGQYAQALEHMQQASINDANKAQANRNYLFKMALSAMVAGDTEAATARTQEYIDAATENGTAFERLRVHELSGYMAMTNDNMEKGVEHLAQANQLNPQVLYWSARAQESLGHKDKARDLATRAAKRNTLSQNLPFVRTEALEYIEKLDES
ncbi:MAG: tetratricopeptide repeat protein [Woeseia sp.]|nr:tetratricopeptide repeat protein [Woeseia sp.]NNE59697.1 tetratricopeptide repeat protein [Woeseia sp.]